MLEGEAYEHYAIGPELVDVCILVGTVRAPRRLRSEHATEATATTFEPTDARSPEVPQTECPGQTGRAGHLYMYTVSGV